MKTFSRRKSAVGRPATDAMAALALRASDSFIMEMHAYIMGILSLGREREEQRSLISSSSSVYEYKHPRASRSRVKVGKVSNTESGVTSSGDGLDSFEIF